MRNCKNGNDMRKVNEINQAVAILRKKGDVVSLEQASVLSNRLNERSVFDKYVTNVPEADRSEEMFFAARDAARYLKGDISLDVLLPGLEEVTGEAVAEEEEEAGTVTLSRKDFNSLLNRIERLEQWVGFRRKPTTVKPVPMPEDMNIKDMVIQRQACACLKCSKITIKKLVAQKVLHAYQKDRNVYYSQKELNKYLKAKQAKEE